MYLRQSTASQEIILGRFVDSTDGNTEETALTIANTDIKIWKEGGTTLASKNSGGATHIANGMYYCVLDATDTDTIGKLEVNVHVTGALSVRREFSVLSADVYDSLFGTSALTTLSNFPTNKKKGVALSNFEFPMYSSTNGDSATGLTVSGVISKDGGAFAALTNSVTEISNGWYKVDLTATEMNANVVGLQFTATGAIKRDVQIITQP